MITTVDTENSSIMIEEMSKVYEPARIETQAYQLWRRQGCFNADPVPDATESAPAYSIVIPPPNVTGALHMGHALNNTLQDILIRFRRMQGYNTLWMPGTDHAGIATQSVVEKQILDTEHKTRHQIGREPLLERIWAWKEQYGNRILDQLKRLGASCDWRRTRFTLDDVCARAVRHTFVNLFRRGLIYRGKRLVNWDPVTQTALADDEVEHRQVEGHFWYIRYPLADGTGSITIATTRPETMLGDTAVAVNPQDRRARQHLGKMVNLPLTDRQIPIIADDYVKRGEGTGFLKVTPAHDPNDYEIGLRHNLPQINILNPDATLNENGGKYQGLDRFQARDRVVADLKKMGLIEKIEPLLHQVGHSYRSHTPVEPYLSDQWYIKIRPLAEPAIDAVTSGRIRFHPARYADTYLDWLRGVRDWCISRQLWWGHRIPIWHKRVNLTKNNWQDELLKWGWDSYLSSNWHYEGIVIRLVRTADGTVVDPDEDSLMPVIDQTEGLYDIYLCTVEDAEGESFEKYGFQRDPDVLDTWFSSALWPHSTFGWPEQNPDLKFYHPTDVLVTSRDIITLWVSRMVMMSLFNMNDIPFSDVFIHGKILDGNGVTMSKSKGNGIDPIDIIESYGADAMRFCLAQMTTECQDIRMPVTQDQSGRNISEKFDIGRNFSNKIWNASRFALANLQNMPAADDGFDPAFLKLEDRWILSRLARAVNIATSQLDEFKFSEPVGVLYRFFWNELCDWYLEIIKPRLRDDAQRPLAQQVLAFVLDAVLRLFHPFVPFITEAIFQQLNRLCRRRGLPHLTQLPPSDNLITAAWPKDMDHLIDADAENNMSLLQTAIRLIRDVRTRYQIPPRKPLQVSIKTADDNCRVLNEHQDLVFKRAYLESWQVDPAGAQPPDAAVALADDMEIYVHGVIDPHAERRRLLRQKAELDAALDRTRAQLENQNFITRAKPQVVQRQRDRLSQLTEKLNTLEKNLAAIQG